MLSTAPQLSIGVTASSCSSPEGAATFVFVPLNAGDSVIVSTTLRATTSGRVVTMVAALALSLPTLSSALIRYVPDSSGTVASVAAPATPDGKRSVAFGHVAPDVATEWRMRKLPPLSTSRSVARSQRSTPMPDSGVSVKPVTSAGGAVRPTTSRVAMSDQSPVTPIVFAARSRNS